MFFFNNNKSNHNINSIQLIKILPMVQIRKKCYCCSHCMFHSTSGNILTRIMTKNKKRKKNEGIVTYTNWFIQLLKSTSSANGRQYVCSSRSFSPFFFSSSLPLSPTSSLFVSLFLLLFSYRIILKSGFDKKKESIHTYENDHSSI